MSLLCENITQSITEDRKNNSSTANSEYALFLIYTLMAFCSIICLCIVALSIFYNKELRLHPSPIIAFICICEAIMSWNALIMYLTPKYVVCYANLYIFLSVSVPG